MIVSAGVVVVRKEGRAWRYLLLRAYKLWDFPKGEPEPGEDLFDTARREVREEAGIRDLDFAWGRAFIETEPYRDGRKIARYYLAETRETEVVFSVNPEIGRPEHVEYRWLTHDEARRLVPDRLGPVLEWARRKLENK
jgi:8-oxo-dGTP pyrophosphatase MutT (NUDIX family)